MYFIVCNLFQVIGVSDESSDLNFFCVRDGTIFTLEEREEPSDEAKPVIEPVRESSGGLTPPSYGYLALVVFDNEHWRRVKGLNVITSILIRLIFVTHIFALSRLE